MTKKQRTLAVSIAVLQAFLFVLMGVWVRMMNQSFTTAQQVFWRMLLAFIMVWLVFGRQFSRKLLASLSAKDWLIYIARAGLNYGFGVMLFTVAITHTTLSTVSFISTLPITGLLAWLMFREKFDAKAVPFVFLSLIGLALVAGFDLSKFSIGIGAGAAIISMLGFDLAWLMVRYHRKDMNNYQNTTLMISFSWIIPLIILVIQHQSLLPTSITRTAYIGLAFSSVLNIVSLYILNYIFTVLKGYVAGNILLLEGVFALVIGYIIYGETTSFSQISGAMIIIICSVAISITGIKAIQPTKVK